MQEFIILFLNNTHPSFFFMLLYLLLFMCSVEWGHSCCHGVLCVVTHDTCLLNSFTFVQSSSLFFSSFTCATR